MVVKVLVIIYFQTEEQQQDETDEQFEERVLNKRAYQMFTVVRQRLQNTSQITLTEMCFKNTKKQVNLFFIYFLCHVNYSIFVVGCSEVLQFIGVKKIPCTGAGTGWRI